MKGILKNQEGAMTIMTLMLLSALFIIMVGVAGIKLIGAAQKAAQADEAFNYLIVMEELAQAVARARSIGRDNIDCAVPVPAVGGCPAGTVRRTVSTAPSITTFCQIPSAPGPGTGIAQYSLCVPDRDGDGVAEASDFCVRIDGYNYCLDSNGSPFNGLTFLTDATTSLPYSGRPAPFVAPGGGSTQVTNGGTLLPRNTAEIWSPSVVWPYNNEMYVSDCGSYLSAPDKYWMGCRNIGDPYMEGWRMRMCRPSTTAVPNTCLPGQMASQAFMIHFENNVR